MLLSFIDSAKLQLLLLHPDPQIECSAFITLRLDYSLNPAQDHLQSSSATKIQRRICHVCTMKKLPATTEQRELNTTFN